MQTKECRKLIDKFRVEPLRRKAEQGCTVVATTKTKGTIKSENEGTINTCDSCYGRSVKLGEKGSTGTGKEGVEVW